MSKCYRKVLLITLVYGNYTVCRNTGGNYHTTGQRRGFMTFASRRCTAISRIRSGAFAPPVFKVRRCLRHTCPSMIVSAIYTYNYTELYIQLYYTCYWLLCLHVYHSNIQFKYTSNSQKKRLCFLKVYTQLYFTLRPLYVIVYHSIYSLHTYKFTIKHLNLRAGITVHTLTLQYAQPPSHSC